MTTQLEIFAASDLDPNIDFLAALLKSHSRWLHASDISAIVLTQTNARWDDRYIRDLASASDGRIISGRKGYRHIDNATLEESVHAAAWLESQAKQMSERACAIRRRLHRLAA